MAQELTVGTGDRISIIISGVKSSSGGGRASRQVDYSGNLAEFLATYGEPEVEVKTPDMNHLKALGKAGDANALQAAMNKLSAELLASSAKPLPQRVVDATCKYLTSVHNFVISDKDPGTDHFYISAGDLTPQMIVVPGDGTEWHVLAAAPFG